MDNTEETKKKVEGEVVEGMEMDAATEAEVANEAATEAEVATEVADDETAA